MPDVPIKPKPPVEPTLAEKAAPALSALRTLLTGDSNGRARRPLLYALAGFGIVIGFGADGLAGVAGVIIAIVSVLLLAVTDTPVGLD